MRLARDVVRHYSRPGALVMDPYAGTGTTLIAARMQGRPSIGAEIDPDTYAMAQRRIAGVARVAPEQRELPW